MGHKMTSKKPYKEISLDETNKVQRIFEQDIDESELEWHRDSEDRYVKIIESNNWYIQFDNQIPQRLINQEVIFIPKAKYHRVIKGKGSLIVEITKK
jgi:hypothetical protein